ncbi:hypothetical protein GCM10023191_063280 [Actinoallomurus oryzae]|uniref:Uncharacterized protein n=1 Tax=Actinoallomurus oryzae TaxID=502180 RepID=A0ABP8QQT3_9ACTN
MELLIADQRYNGLALRTPLNLLPAGTTPEWKAARAALESAYNALDDYDGKNDDLLSEQWRKVAEGKESAYVRAIQNGGTVPERPKGGYVADAEDKRPGIVGEWFRLVREKDKADSAAWVALVEAAPLAIPDAQAAIVAAGEAYKDAETALERARDTFAQAFSYRRDLEQFSRGTDDYTGSSGLPQAATQNVSGTRLPASMVVPNVLRWLDAQYGPADTAERLPAMRRVRGVNGAEFQMEPALALSLERDKNGNRIEYVDGLPPESQISRTGAARVGMSDDA